MKATGICPSCGFSFKFGTILGRGELLPGKGESGWCHFATVRLAAVALHATEAYRATGGIGQLIGSGAQR